MAEQIINNLPNTARDEEALNNIYKTLGKSFREANDREGINEAYYLETVAKRGQVLTWSTLWNALSLWFSKIRFFWTAASQDQTEHYNDTIQPLTWSTVWSTVSWFLGDIPSRYSVDVWRTVWVSIGIMIVFYFPYTLELWRLARKNKRDLKAPRLVIQRSDYARRQRSFRFRVLESWLSKENSSARHIIPWWDAAMLSIRAFLKLGLGTTYPGSMVLNVLTKLEWAIGVFMIIHFILAMKNNLPFIVPFLGVVN